MRGLHTARKTSFCLILAIPMLLSMAPQAWCDAPLQGSVQLSEQLPSLDPTLSPGMTFDQEVATALLGQSASNNVWVKIPTWLAGDWEAREAITTYYRDERTGTEDKNTHPYVSKGVGSWGEIPTKNGWWERVKSNYWTKTIHADYDGYSFVRRLIYEDVGIRSVTLRSWSVCIDVDRVTKKIDSVTQRETVSVYNRITESLIQQIEAHRSYDRTGTFTHTAHNVVNELRVGQPMMRGKIADAESTARLLAKFLHSNSMDDELDTILQTLSETDTQPQISQKASAITPKQAAAKARALPSALIKPGTKDCVVQIKTVSKSAEVPNAMRQPSGK